MAEDPEIESTHHRQLSQQEQQQQQDDNQHHHHQQQQQQQLPSASDETPQQQQQPQPASTPRIHRKVFSAGDDDGRQKKQNGGDVSDSSSSSGDDGARCSGEEQEESQPIVQESEVEVRHDDEEQRQHQQQASVAVVPSNNRINSSRNSPPSGSSSPNKRRNNNGEHPLVLRNRSLLMHFAATALEQMDEDERRRSPPPSSSREQEQHDGGLILPPTPPTANSKKHHQRRFGGNSGGEATTTSPPRARQPFIIETQANELRDLLVGNDDDTRRRVEDRFLKVATVPAAPPSTYSRRRLAELSKPLRVTKYPSSHQHDDGDEEGAAASTQQKENSNTGNKRKVSPEARMRVLERQQTAAEQYENRLAQMYNAKHAEKEQQQQAVHPPPSNNSNHQQHKQQNSATTARSSSSARRKSEGAADSNNNTAKSNKAAQIRQRTSRHASSSPNSRSAEEAKKKRSQRFPKQPKCDPDDLEVPVAKLRQIIWEKYHVGPDNNGSNNNGDFKPYFSLAKILSPACALLWPGNALSDTICDESVAVILDERKTHTIAKAVGTIGGGGGTSSRHRGDGATADGEDNSATTTTTTLPGLSHKEFLVCIAVIAFLNNWRAVLDPAPPPEMTLDDFALVAQQLDIASPGKLYMMLTDDGPARGRKETINLSSLALFYALQNKVPTGFARLRKRYLAAVKARQEEQEREEQERRRQQAVLDDQQKQSEQNFPRQPHCNPIDLTLPSSRITDLLFEKTAVPVSVSIVADVPDNNNNNNNSIDNEQQQQHSDDSPTSPTAAGSAATVGKLFPVSKLHSALEKLWPGHKTGYDIIDDATDAVLQDREERRKKQQQQQEPSSPSFSAGSNSDRRSSTSSSNPDDRGGVVVASSLSAVPRSRDYVNRSEFVLICRIVANLTNWKPALEPGTPKRLALEHFAYVAQTLEIEQPGKLFFELSANSTADEFEVPTVSQAGLALHFAHKKKTFRFVDQKKKGKKKKGSPEEEEEEEDANQQEADAAAGQQPEEDDNNNNNNNNNNNSNNNINQEVVVDRHDDEEKNNRDEQLHQQPEQQQPQQSVAADDDEQQDSSHSASSSSSAQDAACVTIQKNWRGHTARKQYTTERDRRNAERRQHVEKANMLEAALVIQTRMRVVIAKMRTRNIQRQQVVSQQQSAAAVNIQRTWRGHEDRRLAKQKSDQRAAQRRAHVAQSNFIEACVLIQTRMRILLAKIRRRKLLQERQVEENLQKKNRDELSLTPDVAGDKGDVEEL